MNCTSRLLNDIKRNYQSVNMGRVDEERRKSVGGAEEERNTNSN